MWPRGRPWARRSNDSIKRVAANADLAVWASRVTPTSGNGAEACPGKAVPRGPVKAPPDAAPVPSGSKGRPTSGNAEVVCLSKAVPAGLPKGISGRAAATVSETGIWEAEALAVRELSEVWVRAAIAPK